MRLVSMQDQCQEWKLVGDTVYDTESEAVLCFFSSLSSLWVADCLTVSSLRYLPMLISPSLFPSLLLLPLLYLCVFNGKTKESLSTL